ncbi:hypothetical protein [Paraburkholderia bannensis]|uniref:hypothetical protein n=1 Tax=Paraburkholderia bannensis TaxID=765414 RepID=UPI002AB72DE8|nr:hypothetical protein [Paraburkholderia bannensis]
MSENWEIFEKIGATAPNDAGIIDAKVDALMSAAMERIADGLVSMSQETLQEGAVAARVAFERLDELHPIDPTSPAFIGGRLASAADLLGFAASRTALEGAASLARRSPYAQVLSALAENPRRNVDLGVKFMKSDQQICRLLKELRDADLVVPQRRGREVFNVLTPIGRLIVEDGIQEMHRAPLERTNVVDFSANKKVALADLQPRVPVAGTELPRLKIPA